MAKAKTFYQYFEENMRAMGLPAPSSLFGSLTTATATIGAMATYVKTYGTTTTVSEMLLTLPGAAAGAGGGAVGAAAVASEGLLVMGALSAAFYVGACIGSLAVATGRTLAGGLSIADCFFVADKHGIPTGSWLMDTLARNPSLRHRNLRAPAAAASTR
jgi:hypothetical protein